MHWNGMGNYVESLAEVELENGAGPVVERPLRRELYGIDLLRQHARQLALQHRCLPRRGRNQLIARLTANEKILRHYTHDTLRVEKTRRITPAAEWLLD